MSMVIRVDTARRVLSFAGREMPCTIGKGGACPAEDKLEGDGCTPLGRWAVRGALVRRDRVALERPPNIPWRWSGENDGWSDDSIDPAYNRPVALPHLFSHERLWRNDQAYDIIVVLGHNDAPPVPGKGSAIFFHISVTADDGTEKPTEGCIAIAPENMRDLLPLLTVDTVMEII
jgi:L,D-peptidoglycan transpeptidase YkuD (ErfK/YbiS/YcfS/YnhG family)